MFEALRIPQALTDALPDLFIVGGAVRDTIMGQPVNDIDLATSATPEEMLEAFAAQGFKVIPTGLKHGTLTVYVDGQPYEVTTFRTDVQADGRHAQVEFVRNIEDDLSRRDFTMNAMAYNVRTHAFIDPFNGQLDIARNYINTVGMPHNRFTEDYLRIIRAARFAAKYNMAITKEVRDMMIHHAPEILEHVAIERIVQEFDKAFTYERPSMFIRELYNIGFMSQLIPEMDWMHNLPQNPKHHPEGDVLTHTLTVLDHAPSTHRWHALLHDIGKTVAYQETEDWWYSYHGHEKAGAAMVPAICDRLKLPTKLSLSIEVTTRYHMHPYHITRNGVQPKSVRRFQNTVGEYLEDLRILCTADAMGRRPVPDVFEPMPEATEPALKGRHLIEAGLTPGPHFTPLLRHALDYQLETGCTDTRTLLSVAMQYHSAGA